MNDSNLKPFVNLDAESPKAAKSPTLTRRQSLITLSSLLGGGLLAKSVYADLVNSLLGKSSASLIDKTISPSHSLFLSDGGPDTYTMRTTGLPDHPTGVFPSDACPNAILPLAHVFKIPKTPEVASVTTELRGSLFGVAMNGVVFDPTGPFWRENSNSGWQYEVMSAIARQHLGLDFTNAHTQNTGEYHYHGRCNLLQQTLETLMTKRGDPAPMCLLGFAADGFPIYAPYAPEDPNNPQSPVVVLRSSYQRKLGSRSSNEPGRKLSNGTIDRTIDGTFVEDHQFTAGLGHLDQCNGRFGMTPEFPNGIYYYVLTDTFPFIPRFWRGTPNESFFKAPPSGATEGASGPVPAELTKMFT